MTPIFILSNPRAGSTLLRYVLDTHPDICSPAELRLGMVCRVLLNVLELTHDHVDAPPQMDKHARRFARIADIVGGVMDDYCRAKQKRRWCEKSPHNIDHLDVLHCVFPDAQYLCLHRHGLDAVKSLIDSGMDVAGASALGAAVERWCRRTERLMAFETTYERNCLRVRYEDLVGTPEDCLAKVMAFLQVRPVPALHERAFEVRHDIGPGDQKIHWTSAIERTRIGQGSQLDLATLPPRLHRRLTGLLDALGY